MRTLGPEDVWLAGWPPVSSRRRCSGCVLLTPWTIHTFVSTFAPLKTLSLIIRISTRTLDLCPSLSSKLGLVLHATSFVESLSSSGHSAAFDVSMQHVTDNRADTYVHNTAVRCAPVRFNYAARSYVVVCLLRQKSVNCCFPAIAQFLTISKLI